VSNACTHRCKEDGVVMRRSDSSPGQRLDSPAQFWSDGHLFLNSKWFALACPGMFSPGTLCRVAIRCCPTQNDAVIKVDGEKITLQRPRTTLTKVFNFAHIYPSTAGNGDVHELSVSEHVRAAVGAAESITVLTFGARSTGKTHTMRSRDGMVLRTASDVFGGLGVGDRCMVTVSCLMSAVATPVQSHLTGRQVTHEILLDGMLPQGEVGEYRGGLHVREHPTKGFFVEGLSEIAVDNVAECEEYLRQALANCAAEEARCGSGSAGAPLRVHCLFTMRVRRQSASGESVSDVQLLDLAGWVRDKPAGKKAGVPAAVVGEDMVLKAFQRIVSSLETKAGHIPYRDSKMTRLLQPALGGCALCIPLVHIAVDNYEETEAMLTLATKLASISCKVQTTLQDRRAQLADQQARVHALCQKLGRRAQGLKSSDIILGMNSSDDLLALRDTLASMEQGERDGSEWARAAEASLAFKADGGESAALARVDRKPKKAPRFEQVADAAPAPEQGHARAHARAGKVVAGRRGLEEEERRFLPPARGHGNDTPRGNNEVNEHEPAVQAHPMESVRQPPPLDAARYEGKRDAAAVLRHHGCRQEKGGEEEAPRSKMQARVYAGEAHRIGGEVVSKDDAENISARLAKVQQQQHKMPLRQTCAPPAASPHKACSPAELAERLALLRSQKPQASRLRSMS
jgi:hypothetical protein